MTRKLVLLAVSISFGAITATSFTPAHAQDVTYKKETKYDFDDDMVEGDLVRPEGEMIGSAGKAKHSSLIKVRQHFIPEMLKSAEDI
jgi:glutamine cyclotransferase